MFCYTCPKNGLYMLLSELVGVKSVRRELQSRIEARHIDRRGGDA
jgi:hypothetical protein